mgnify:FL=1
MLNQLNQYAIQHNIDVDFFSMRAIKALSIPGAIALNPLMIHTMPELIDAYSHELGHHETGSFYKIDSKYETRQRMEEKATRWAVQELIPADKLLAAFEMGYTEIWQLAEYFNVTEDFIKNTIRIHLSLIHI